MKLVSSQGQRVIRKPSKVQHIINHEPKKAVASAVAWTLLSASVFFLPAAPAAAASEPEPTPTPVVATMAAEETAKPTDVEIMATGIYSVIRGRNVSDTAAVMVGEVIENRRQSHIFPNTLDGVITQPYQFGDLSKGYDWAAVAATGSRDAAMAYEAAEEALAGSNLLADDVFYVSESSQGELVAKLSGLCFGR